MGFFEFLYKSLVKPVGCIITIIILVVLSVIVCISDGVGNFFKGNKMETYREYITNGEYDKACDYALAHDLDISDVLSKQTYDKLMDGDISEAQALCARYDQMYVFFHTFLTNLQAVYDKKGINAVVLAFSMIPYPSPSESIISEDCLLQWGIKDSFYSQKSIAEENNRCIEALCQYLQAKGKDSDIDVVLNFLQPCNNYEDISEDEVNRIKNKFSK